MMFIQFLRKLFSIKLLKYILGQNFIRKKIFKYIYESGYWIDYNISSNQSRSGKGSNIERALYLQNSLKIFFKKNKIKKIIDIGCGDFNWMNNLLKDIEYPDHYKYVDRDIKIIKGVLEEESKELLDSFFKKIRD